MRVRKNEIRKKLNEKKGNTRKNLMGPLEERRSGMRRRARNKTHDEASFIVIGSTPL